MDLRNVRWALPFIFSLLTAMGARADSILWDPNRLLFDKIESQDIDSTETARIVSDREWVLRIKFKGILNLAESLDAMDRTNAQYENNGFPPTIERVSKMASELLEKDRAGKSPLLELLGQSVSAPLYRIMKNRQMPEKYRQKAAQALADCAIAQDQSSEFDQAQQITRSTNYARETLLNILGNGNDNPATMELALSALGDYLRQARKLGLEARVHPSRTGYFSTILTNLRATRSVMNNKKIREGVDKLITDMGIEKRIDSNANKPKPTTQPNTLNPIISDERPDGRHRSLRNLEADPAWPPTLYDRDRKE